MKDELITYNYMHICGCSSKRLQIKCKEKDKPKCQECGKPLKRLGIASHNLRNYG